MRGKSTRRRKGSPASKLAVLAPRRNLVHISKVPTELIDQAIQSFADVIGGRATFQAELAVAPDLSPELQTVRLLLADPRLDTLSLGEICRKANVQPCDLFKAFRDAAIAKANLEAMTLVARRLPEIAADLITQAVSRTEVCPRCQGTGTVIVHKEPAVCSRCRQTGTVTIPGSLEHQRLALELSGLLKKGGFSFAQQIVVPHGDSSFGSLEQLQQAVASVLSGATAPEETYDADILGHDDA